jgi:hypothetical protein
MSIDDIPPDGGNRPMREALDAELRRESDDGEGAKATMLQLIARKLAAKAREGDLGAIKEIFDRHGRQVGRRQRRGRAAGKGSVRMERSGIMLTYLTLTHPPSLLGLTPQVGFTRLAAHNAAQLGRARVAMQSIALNEILFRWMRGS